MSSVIAEVAMDLKFKKEEYEIPLGLEIEDIKQSHFDDSYDNKAGPSSAGLEEHSFFDDLPVLEKGNGPSPIEAGEGVGRTILAPFVLDESNVRYGMTEGGWAGWTCVAGSWLVCES